MVRGRRAASTAKCRVRHRPNASGPRSRIRAEEVQVECDIAIHGGAAVTCYWYKIECRAGSIVSQWSGAYGARVKGEVCMSFICAVQVASAVYVSECQDTGMQEEMKLCNKIEH